VAGAAAEIALLVLYPHQGAAGVEAVAHLLGPPPREIHGGLVAAGAGERVPLEQGLGVWIGLGGGVLPHGVEEHGWRDQATPAGALAVVRIGVQGVVVAIAKGEVAGAVPAHLEIVGRVGLRLPDADALAGAGQVGVGKQAIVGIVGVGGHVGS